MQDEGQLTDCSIVRQFKEGPVLRVMHTYADNGAIVGTRQNLVTKCQEIFESMNKELARIGFEAHEKSSGVLTAIFFGHQIDGEHSVIRQQKRFWRLCQIFMYVEKCSKVNSGQLERLLGHCMFLLMLDRPMSSIFSYVSILRC